MKCAIVMAVYGGVEYLADAIASVDAQKPLDGWEYELRIGVDACPDAAAALDGMRRGYYMAAENSGAYIVRNALAMAGDADCFAVFDGDDIMFQDYLLTLIPAAMRHGVAGAAKDYGAGSICKWASAHAVFRRDVFSALEGFAPERISGDLDFVYRAELAGYDCGICDRPLMYYRTHAKQITQDVKRGQKSAERERVELAQDIRRIKGESPGMTTVELIWRAPREPSVSVVALVPKDAWRLRLWDRCRAQWERLGCEIVEVVGDDKKYSRAICVNRGIEKATGDILIVADTDIIIDTNVIDEAIGKIGSGQYDLAEPKTTTRRMTIEETNAVLLGAWPSLSFVMPGYPASTTGGVFVVSRVFWARVKGMDERFRGWGLEDSALGMVCKLMARVWIGGGAQYHLWHEPQPENVANQRVTESMDSNAVYAEYKAAYLSGGMAAYIKTRKPVKTDNYKTRITVRGQNG